MRIVKRIIKPVGIAVGATNCLLSLILNFYTAISLGLWFWIWLSIGLLIFVVSVIAVIYGREKQVDKRTGIRMSGGKGTFKDTRISGQDVAIDVNATELNMEDTDIK
jgi:hypothetical protein